MFCNKCGNKINNGEKFCNKCGNQVNNVQSVQPVMQPINQPEKQPAVQPTTQVANSSVTKKPVDKKILIIAAIATVVIVIGTVCIAGFFNSNNKPTVSDDDVYYYDDDSSNDKYYENNDYYYDNIEDDTSTGTTIASNHTNKETETTKKQETTTKKETTTQKETTTKKETTTQETSTKAEITELALYDEENWLSCSDSRVSFKNQMTAVNNKVYYNCIRYRHTKDCAPTTLKFLLEGEYNTVSGVYFSPKENATSNRTGQAFFEVYGDGKLIYTSPIITAESLPIDFEFSVSSVHKLEFVFKGSGSSVWGADAGMGFGDFAAISELTAHK